MNIIKITYFILYIIQINALLQQNDEPTKTLQRKERHAQKSSVLSGVFSKFLVQKSTTTIKPAPMFAVGTKATSPNTPVPVKGYSSKIFGSFTPSDKSNAGLRESKNGNGEKENLILSTTTNITRNKKAVPPYSTLLKTYFDGMKNKDQCESSTCDILPPSDFKYGGLAADDMVADGLVIHKCGKKNKTFLLTKATYVQMGLWKQCCLLGMTPATIETRDELNCLYDAYKKFEDKSISQNHLFLINYWDYGKREMRSCPDRSLAPEELWMEDQPDNAKGAQSVVAVNLKGTRESIGFDDVAGLEKNNLLCQIIVKQRKLKKVIPYSKTVVNLYKTMGPQNYSCEARLKECKKLYPNKPYRFAGQDTVLQPDGILLTKCSPNKHYFLSTSSAPYLANYIYCCSMGMLPGIIETREEMDCVNAYYKNYTSKFGARKKSFMLGFYDDKLNHEFKSCPDQFELPPDELFAFGEPSNNLGAQNCISVYLGASKLDSGIDDCTCLEKLSPLCERIIPPNEKQMKPYANTTLKLINSITNNGKKDICDYNKCKNHRDFNPLTIFRENGTKGIFHSGCNEKIFFLSFTPTVGTKLWEVCCSFNMVPAVFKSREEMNCLYNPFRTYSAHPKFNAQKNFLVSYMDASMNFTYFACPDKEKVPANLWAPGQPDNAKGNEACVVVAFDNTRRNVGFHDAPCEQNLYVPLCQVHDENAGLTVATETEEFGTVQSKTTTTNQKPKPKSRFDDDDE